MFRNVRIKSWFVFGFVFGEMGLELAVRDADFGYRYVFCGVERALFVGGLELSYDLFLF